MYFAPDQERVGLAAFAEEPERYPLATPSGKVELAGAACLAAGLSEVPDARVRRADDARLLRLITPKSRYRVHSQLDDLPWFRERDDRSLWINPADAAARGMRARRPTRRLAVVGHEPSGRVRCACRVTDDVMPGVVSLCEGIEPEFEAAPDADGAARAPGSMASTSPARPTSSPRTSRRCRAAARRCTRRSSKSRPPGPGTVVHTERRRR